MPPDTALTEAELADIENWAKQDLAGNLGQQANARRTLRLVEEVRWYRTVIASIYHMVPDVPGTKKLQAELEREAARLGVIKPTTPDASLRGRGARAPGSPFRLG